MLKKAILCLAIIGLILFPGTLDFTRLNESRAENSRLVISTDTTWTEADGPHLLIGTDLAVNPGVTLTLAPGTIVKLASSSINVKGILRVQGTVEAPVVFTSINDQTWGGDSNGASNLAASPGDWGFINVSGGQAYFYFAKIYYGGVIDVYLVGKSRFLNYADAFSANVPVINLYKSRAEITNSEIAKNKAGIVSDSSILAVHGSKISDNSDFGLIGFETEVDAVGNWWGDNSGPFNEESNVSGLGNLVRGSVLFDPWVGKGEAPSNQAPVLSYASEIGYNLDTGSEGVEPNKGRADLTDFVFKAVYADADNDAPAYFSVVVEGPDSCLPYSLVLDGSSTSQANLRDGSFNNGEQYALKMKFPQGKYKYHFIASDGQQEIRWPALGELEFEAGYSNIAFLPGIQASRLYAPGLIFENQLWEPNRQADVEKLFLDEEGKSVRGDVYTRDVIDEVYGFMGNVYKTFLESLDRLVASRTVNRTMAMPYDWRLGLDSITGDPIKTETGSYRMIAEIEKLAADSQTGKVTLVAHSMGGLVAKRLMQRLESLGEANLVDQLILVASPQAGTPEAALGLLHGDGLELGGGFVLSKATAREFGENMKSAYSLLPSAAYFARAEGPVIEFQDSALLHDWRYDFGAVIDTTDGLNNFLLGKEGRSEPAASDTNTPNVVSEELLDETVALHESLDAWTPPEGVKVTQIAGWGLDTISGFKYVEKKRIECPDGNYDNMAKCNSVSYLDREPVFSMDGDKTVMLNSADYMGGVEDYYLNLDEYNNQNIDRNHASIFEVEPVQNLIKEILVNNLTNLPSFITLNKNDLLLDSSNIRVSVHSPVSLDIYDSEGRHTGKIKNSNPDSDLEMVEEAIPNSYYRSIGEGQYAGMKSDDIHRLSLQGLDYGTFSLDLTEVKGKTETNITYDNIPVTPNTKVSLVFDDLESRDDLQLDFNGDGIVDSIIDSSQDRLDPLAYIGVIEHYVKSMKLEKNVKKILLIEFQAIEKLLIKNKNKTIAKINKKLAVSLLKLTKNEVERFPKKIVDKQEVFVLLNMISNLINLT